MRFGLSSDQTQAQDALRTALARAGGLDLARAAAKAPAEAAERLRPVLAELGVYAMRVPEAHGGLGLSLLDAALMAEGLGGAVAPAAFIGSAVIGPLAIAEAGSAAQHARLLPALATGALRLGVALSEVSGARDGAGVEAGAGRLHGRALFVLDFDADVYLVADGTGGLHLVEAGAANLAARALTTIDVTRRVGELSFDGAVAEPLPGSSPAAVQRLIQAGRIALAADTLGAAQAMLDQAVAYAKQREQFGRPIGAFQAVKHMCAEMAAALEPCRALVWYAAHAFEHLPDEAALAACHAKAHLAEVGTRIAKTATEVHGGMGFTDLVGLHYWFKRIGFNRQALGGPAQVRREAAALQGL